MEDKVTELFEAMITEIKSLGYQVVSYEIRLYGIDTDAQRPNFTVDINIDTVSTSPENVKYFVRLPEHLLLGDILLNKKDDTPQYGALIHLDKDKIGVSTSVITDRCCYSTQIYLDQSKQLLFQYQLLKIKGQRLNEFRHKKRNNETA